MTAQTGTPLSSLVASFNARPASGPRATSVNPVEARAVRRSNAFARGLPTALPSADGALASASSAAFQSLFPRALTSPAFFDLPPIFLPPRSSGAAADASMSRFMRERSTTTTADVSVSFWSLRQSASAAVAYLGGARPNSEGF